MIEQVIFFVGLVVSFVLAIGIGIPIIVGSCQFWASVYSKIKRIRAERKT